MTSDRAIRRGLASTHTHMHAHAGRPGAQGGPHPAAGTCRPAPGLLGTALWRASRRAAPPNHEARSRPTRPVPRAAGEPASRAPASCLPVGDANRARGAAGAVGEVAGAKSARHQPRSIATKASGWRHGRRANPTAAGRAATQALLGKGRRRTHGHSPGPLGAATSSVSREARSCPPRRGRASGRGTACTARQSAPRDLELCQSHTAAHGHCWLLTRPPGDWHSGRDWGESHHHHSGTRWLDLLTDATPCWHKRPFTSLRFSAVLMQAIEINIR